ncbi:DUF760 domain containing protein [Nitzschia inconspicua]|uniref:DUF760 domain containing protein n=1 Tax=Nitzschia inconspicua TaxID=303405 RepID=A0A9K3KFQ9_9STRA|nr:DUF760 domain containing protein [Nitzschia inconspicua]
MKQSTSSPPFSGLATATAAAAVFLSTAILTFSTRPPHIIDAFQPICRRHHGLSVSINPSAANIQPTRRRSLIQDGATATALFSSVGGRGNDRPRPPGDSNDNNLGDFLDPMRKPDSENLKRAREFMSETSLPLSFDAIDEDDEDEGAVTPTIDTTSAASSSLTSSTTSKFSNSATSSALFGTDGAPSSDLLAKNPYMQVVSKISPSDVIAKFTATADPRVQEAVRTTILGLIGSLPKLAFETTSITTGQRLASLMFQLQMTGYMFKNAEYRMSMSQSLGMYSEMTSNLLLTGAPDDDDDDETGREDPLLSGKIKGKLRIRYGKTKAWTPRNDQETVDEGSEIEVDAAAYMSELRAEVSKLREELVSTKEAKEEALRKDLLLYIRTLPAQELKSLTNTMSQDVLVCMKGLVQAVLAGIGDGQIGPDTVTEQSGEAMAQLCMWQLAVGYNLRELEVREEMKKNLKTILGESSTTSNDNLSEPGAFE